MYESIDVRLLDLIIYICLYNNNISTIIYVLDIHYFIYIKFLIIERSIYIYEINNFHNDDVIIDNNHDEISIIIEKHDN